ncbi:MAG: dihydrofolate reductase [Clostridia bacterium]|nr:dihydrofolate reductase [Clostridia bacterium]
MFTIIAVIGKNLELGKNGSLIWHLPNDLKFFKEKTTGHKVFMGRNTYLSLPKKLPNREHFVLTDCQIEDSDGIVIITDLDEFVKKYKDVEEEIFVIGGAMVYSEMLPYSQKMYLTEVDMCCNDASVYFPKFDKEKYIRKELYSNEDYGIKYKHVEYIKK